MPDVNQVSVIGSGTMGAQIGLVSPSAVDTTVAVAETWGNL